MISYTRVFLNKWGMAILATKGLEYYRRHKSKDIKNIIKTS
uniref:Uncharacterized protein n=1 Tax=viral metagenome TaxID=1070528 RepID=A0A6C0CKH7_9ZZZZ